MTTKANNNGTYSIEGLTLDQIALIAAMLNDAKESMAEQKEENGYYCDEQAAELILSDNECEILETINVEF